MRHRIGIASQTGLGNPSEELLKNQWSGDVTYNKIIKTMLKEGVGLYFKDIGGCDFTIHHNRIEFGIEPTYQFDKLKIISVNKEIGLSCIQTGVAFDLWGSGICASTKWYKDYKLKSKFVRFVDKWHKIIY